jgi:UDP-hydrolysing UDP-N-acetyl-D-glucosamine 2-epimerase
LDDGFEIAAEVPLSIDKSEDITELTTEAIQGCGQAFAQLKPQAVVLLGDRYECFGAAVAAYFAGIPIAHLHGGETTEGAVDDALRHCITQLATWHFTAALPYLERVRAMGAPPSRSHCVGPLVLDALKEPLQLTRKEFEEQTGFQFGHFNLLITYHPETLAEDLGIGGLNSLLQALENLIAGAQHSIHMLITGVNADPGGKKIRETVQRFQEIHRDCCWLHQSLGQRRYLAALRWFDAVVGNSSSGIIEAPLVGTPVLNIGDRQRGRYRFGEVQEAQPVAEEITAALRQLAETRHCRASGILENWEASPAAQICRTLEKEVPCQPI